MSSVSPIAHDETFPQDAVTAQDRVDSAKLQTQVSNIKIMLNQLLAALDAITRDDDTINDQHIRLRMLHPELLAALASTTAWKPKQNVRGVSAVTDIALSGPLSTDGVTFSDGDRILVAAQVLSPATNGIWIVNTGGAWTRAADCDTVDEINFALVNVTSGTLYGGSTWLQNLTVATLGVSPVKFDPVFTAAAIGAGAGLTKFGTNLAVNVDGTTIELASNALRVKDGGISLAKLAASSVDADKVVNAALTNAKLANMATLTVKANATGAPAAPQDITVDALLALLGVMGFDAGAGGSKGLVPPSAAGDAAAGKFLSPAGWAVPSGGGGGGGGGAQAFKDPCRAATTGNITLSGTQTIDGVACIVGDRVLVRAQTASAENGIYTVAAGAWPRSTDADTDTELVPGTVVYVTEGTLLAGINWQFAGSGTYTLGVTAIQVRPVNPLSYGRMSGTGVSVTAVLAKLSAGITTTAGGRISAGTAQWTVLSGGAGTYRLRLSFWTPVVGISTADLDLFRVYKNGALLLTLDAHIARIEYKDQASVNRAGETLLYEDFLALLEGDYLEFYGEMSSGTTTTFRLQATIERVGD